MKKCCSRFFSDPEYFGAVMLRLGFGLLFLFAGIAKLRMGYGGFAEMLVGGEGNFAKEVPAVLTQIYGYILPAAELLAGVLILSGCKKHSKYGYGLAGLIYLSFVFGQAYDGNFSVIGGEYFPSMLALFFAWHLSKKAAK